MLSNKLQVKWCSYAKIMLSSDWFILQVKSMLAHREVTDQLFNVYPKSHCSWEVLSTSELYFLYVLV